MEKVLITGGTGLIGKYLSDKLVSKGYEVAFLSRKSSNSKSIKSYQWNVEQMTMDEEALSSSDYIFHLAGANIGEKRWSAKRREEIVESRVNSGQLLYETFKKSNSKLKAFISASAVGYYGAITSDKIFSETDEAAQDFLGETCKQWENSIEGFRNSDVRTVVLRTGVVLSEKGGALEKMMLPFRLGIGSPTGSGNQYMAWIHIEDLCNMYIKAIQESKMNGVYNAVAPEHVTNRLFCKTLAKVMKKPFWFPSIPAFVLKLLLGKMSEIVLTGSRVSCQKIIQEGFEFSYPTVKGALQSVLTGKSD